MNARPGLSLLEVMLAVLIIGVCVTTLLALQGKLSRAVFTAHALIDRLPFVAGFFVSAEKDRLYLEKKLLIKTIEDPELTMTYSVSKSASKGLAQFQHLVIEKIDAQWPTIMGTRTETFAQARFVPRPEKGLS